MAVSWLINFRQTDLCEGYNGSPTARKNNGDQVLDSVQRLILLRPTKTTHPQKQKQHIVKQAVTDCVGVIEQLQAKGGYVN